MPLTFTWSSEPDRSTRSGIRKVLRCPDFPEGSLSPLCADDRLAVCSQVAPRTWEAQFWIGFDAIKAQAGTMAAAIRRLERELDRRSIGLFDADDIHFVHAEA